MKPLARETIADQIEQLEPLDAVSEPLQKAVRSAIPQESQLKDILSGTWLGHPLHPPLTDVVIGAWTSALLLDLLVGRDGEQAADRLVAAGILAAVPTACAGLSDWAELGGGSRRVGTAHALGNTTALLLHTLSWFARRRGDRARGVTLSVVGYGVASFSAWLGGHLSFAKGVGVNQTAFEDAPTEWTAVLDDAQLLDGKLTAARADGVGCCWCERAHGFTRSPTAAHIAAARSTKATSIPTTRSRALATGAFSDSTGESSKGRQPRHSRRSRRVRTKAKWRSGAT